MWRIFAGLGRRLGLSGFAELEAEADDAILAAAARRSRVPWETLRAAPSGAAPTDIPAPGWLIPKRLPRGILDLAPPELVDQLHAWQSAAAEPELVLVNRRELRQTNSMLRDGARRPALLMHPDDAASLGLAPDQPVRISTPDGSTAATLDVTAAIRPGAVSLPHGWNAPAVNALTSSSTDVEPLTGMPRLSGLAVEVAADVDSPAPLEVSRS